MSRRAAAPAARTARSSSSLRGVLEALATLASEGDPRALDGIDSGELVAAVGLTGLEVHHAGDGRLLWSCGSGRPGQPVRHGGVSVLPLGGDPVEGPVWRALVGLLVITLGGRPLRTPSTGTVGIDGASTAAAELRETVRRVAPTDLAVLLLGETGTGKEVVARAIHRLSGRSGAFVPVNVAAVPTDLVEAELFGAVRGAYTGAHRGRLGLVRAADGGTLFLDEIGDLEAAVQTKLLRVLESGEVRPVGSTSFVAAATRVVAATHRNLEAALQEGSFRTDLYYRLAQAVIRVPPLRDRLDDLAVLRTRFEDEASQRLGLPRCRWSAAAEASLSRYGWPGNVRELRHVVERALVEASGGVVTRSMLPFSADGAVGPRRWDQAIASFRRSFLSAALRRNGGNRSATARELGISRQTLLYHLRSLGLGGPAFRGGEPAATTSSRH